MRRAYICSPLSGNISGNIENAKRYARYIFKCGMAPVIPHLWVFGDEITEGMKKEIIFAEKLNIKVKYISEKELKKTEVI